MHMHELSQKMIWLHEQNDWSVATTTAIFLFISLIFFASYVLEMQLLSFDVEELPLRSLLTLLIGIFAAT